MWLLGVEGLGNALRGGASCESQAGQAAVGPWSQGFVGRLSILALQFRVWGYAALVSLEISQVAMPLLPGPAHTLKPGNPKTSP